MLKVSQLRAQTAKYADALIFNSAGFFLLVSLVLYALKPSIAMVPTKYDKVVLFGDSLTQQAWSAGGTGAALTDEYQRRYDVLNRGFSGYNSRWAKEVAPHAFNDTENIALAVVWLGANDAVLDWKSQHVPLEEFKMNLQEIVQPLLKTKTPVVLLTPPPFEPVLRRADIDRRFPENDGKLERTIERTASFAQAVLEVGEQLGVPTVDVHRAFMAIAMDSDDRATGLKPLLTDGVHLTAQGYKVVTSALLSTIQSSWPALAAEKIQKRFPTWDSIDPKDFKKAFEKLRK